ncbi:MAG: LamG domain-containing protein [Phycisphaerales bacterium]|nr:MAG: LamG domain-containing protein [Phycisphaerales bacterium]
MNEFRTEPSAEMDRRIHGDIAKTLAELERTTTAVQQQRMWRTIMRNPMTKLAVAVVVVITALLLVKLTGDGDSIVWAEVLDNVNRANVFSYRMQLNFAGMIEGNEGTELVAEALVSTEQGVRIKSYRDGNLNAATYFSVRDRNSVTIVPSDRTQLRMSLMDAILEKLARENGDPRKLVEQFTRHYDTKLGRKFIDGVEVEGIVCHNPIMAEGVLAGAAGWAVHTVVGRLWADTERRLPVRLEAEAFNREGERLIEFVTFDYRWDVQIEADDFVPDVSSGNVIVMSDEESIRRGLEFFANQANGRYPTDLSEMTIGRELRSALMEKFGVNPPWPDNEKMFSLQIAVRFYRDLVIEERKPAYHGDTVTADFPDAVLMRWRQDDGSYRVIFGDLSISETTADQLAKLEAKPLNPKPSAVRPRPADGASGIATEGVKLSWLAGIDAREHRVYLGTKPGQLAFAESVDSPIVEMPVLEKGRVYFWRVDEVQSDGSIISGDVWHFDTGRLVAWWKLDDASGNYATDSSGNGHDGLLQGDPDWIDGVVGGALLFDGDGDFVNVGKDPDFEIRDEITVSAWMKSGGFDRQWETIISKGDSSWRLQRHWGSTALEFACTGVAVVGANFGDVYGKSDVDDGRWHHVAGVYDGKMMYLYLDGTVDASGKASGRIRLNDHPVYIGENAEKANRFWKGMIDDVRVYNYALAAEDIRALRYAGTLP